MPLAPGTKLGPYEILAAIGAGGMGEVYRAHDPRLNRDVAVKVSAAHRLSCPLMGRRWRFPFRREAAVP
jgi:eukaryotic-like serine/threonine-protein kinase